MSISDFSLIVFPPEGEDDTFQTPDEIPDRGIATHRRLTAAEQLQVAVWIVEGASNPKIFELQAETGMPVLTHSALTRYRQNRGLLEEAKKYLRVMISGVGLAEKAVRIRKLQKHADRLADMIDKEGLWAIEQKVIGWGKQSEHIETRKFDAALSKEYRETIRQIAQEVEPLQTVVQEQTNNFFLNLSVEDRESVMAALTWMPKVVPHLIEGEIVREVVDASPIAAIQSEQT